MEGLVDYVRRQVKCPECRAEHRIPYQGVQAFPTNVTLQRFLELRMEITGEPPDPTSGKLFIRYDFVCWIQFINRFQAKSWNVVMYARKNPIYRHVRIVRRRSAKIVKAPIWIYYDAKSPA